MSHVTQYHIAEVLQEVCTQMKDVSANVFPESRPSATQQQMSDFIVVSLPVLIDDQNAFQRTTLRIEIFVKNRASGVAYTKRLQELLNATIGKFPIATKRFSATAPRLLLKGADGLGFTAWNVQAKLIINTTDSYK